MDNNKKSLVDHIWRHGKTASWDRLAQQFGLANGEVARSTWRKYKGNMNNIKEVLQEDISGVYWGSKKKEEEESEKELLEYIKLANEALQKNLEIPKMEELIKKLATENATPKDRLVRSMNIGPNPLDYSLELQKETIMAEMRKASSKATPFTIKKSADQDNLLELSMFDLHIGKLSWDKETGEDYDIEIATKRYMDAISALVSRVNINTIERILLPIGNDMINIDGKEGTTTAGTPQDGDSRFGKMFTTAKRLLIDSITQLAVLAPVDVMIIPGNHDELTMFTLGEVLDAWFHNNDDVTIHNSPKLRKYYEYGECMLMFTHGNREKHSDLGIIAATEEKQMWGRTTHREVHVGHFHKSKVVQYLAVDEFQGFKVRILPSLSGTDAWHYSKGYMSQKAAKAFVWNKKEGLISEHTYTV